MDMLRVGINVCLGAKRRREKSTGSRKSHASSDVGMCRGHSYDPHRWFDQKLEWKCPCASTERHPGNYGFVPHTLSQDGDPIDVLVARRAMSQKRQVCRTMPVPTVKTRKVSQK